MGDIFREHQYAFTEGAIRIRPSHENDLDMLQKWGDDPEVLYFSEGDDVSHYDIEDIKGIYRSVKDSAYCFIIEYSGVRIGECWLQKMNDRDLLDAFPEKDLRRIDLTIGEKDYWNRGIGTVVIKMLSAFGFGNQNADMIFCLAYDYNKRSIRAAEKAGYKVLGTTPVKDSIKARYRVNMALTRDGYRKETGMVKETGINA